MIFRTVHNRNNPYFQMNRSAVNDDSLSYKALGIHAYLMSKPDGWEANESDIVSRHTEGREAVRAGIKELIERGYMHRTRVVDAKGKVVKWQLDVYESPELNPHYNANPESENQTVEPESGFPEVEKPECGKPESGFPTHSKYKNIVNTETENKSTPSPVAQQPPQMLPPSSTGDPLMDMAAARFANRANGKTGSWQAEFNTELSADKRIPLANRLAEIWKMKDAIEAGNDKHNRTCQEVAIRIYKLGVHDVKALDTQYAAYLADEWRKKNNPNPRPEKMEEFISQSKPSVEKTSVTKTGWKGFNSDLPEYMREMMQ